jgi:hypothetical protein
MSAGVKRAITQVVIASAAKQSDLSFRDRQRRGPESMNTVLWNMDSGLAALPRPGMTGLSKS